MIARFHCDETSLMHLLHDTPHEETNEVLAHVETCETCQAKLETLCSGGMSWKEVNELMQQDELSPATSSTQTPSPDDDEETPRNPTPFLRPTDHPHSLGRFARFEIMEILGRGGMGIVMRGYDTSLDRYCAVKVLAPELASSAAARKRFSREAKSAAAVVHPHVVPIQTVDEYDGLPYLVMPVIEGKSLQQKIEFDGPLSLIESVRIALQISKGLAAAHGQGLVHRDIKPANILLENGVERVQITDFGLARAVDDASVTRSGVIAGTPQYMSPEQAHGDEIDYRSDLFSLGSVIYFMLAGRSPFRAETTMGVLNRIANDQPRRLQTIHPNIPSWLEGIVMKLLSKSPSERFGSAQEIAQLLEECIGHLQAPASTPPPASIATTLVPQQNARPPVAKLVAAGSLAFAFVLAGVLLVLDLNKGTLTIESEIDDIAIRILKSDQLVESFTVSKQGESTRVAAGNYVVELNGQFPNIEIDNAAVSLSKGGNQTIKIRRTTQASSDASEISEQLSGSWRVMNLRWDETQMNFGENVVITFDKWKISSFNERESTDQHVYQLLPNNRMRVIPYTVPVTDKGLVELHYRYKLLDADHLEMQICDAEDVPTEQVLRLIRLKANEPPSTLASETVSVDLSSPNGYEESEVLNTHARLIRSERFLKTVRWPKELLTLSQPNETTLQNLRTSLLITPDDNSHIQIVLHGDVRTKPERSLIVKTIADTYRKQFPQPRSAVDEKRIDDLTKSHRAILMERSVAETEHGRLIADGTAKMNDVAQSMNRLAKLNELLSERCDQLFQYGVPALTGDLNLSLSRAQGFNATAQFDSGWKWASPLTFIESNAAIIEFADLQREQNERTTAYDQAVSNASDELELKRVYEDMDPREIMPPKYLAFEAKHRGSETGLQALQEVARMAVSVGDPASVAAIGRVESANRILNHYIGHRGLEKIIPLFKSGPFHSKTSEFLQQVIEKSPHRDARAEALIAQVLMGKRLLSIESQLLTILREQRKNQNIAGDDPPHTKTELQQTLANLEYTDFSQLRKDLNTKLKKLEQEYFDVQVERYGTGGNAARRLSHAINNVVIGKAAPEITSTTVEGSPFQLSEHRGKIVVLLFSQNTTDDFKKMYAPIRQLVAKYSWAPVKIVGIINTDQREVLRAASARGDLNFTVIPQPLLNAPLSEDWGIEGYPSVRIIDAAGTLQPERYMPYYGEGGYDTHEVDDAIAKLLASPHHGNKGEEGGLEAQSMPSETENNTPVANPAFATPESLMKYYADCQFRDDVAGCLECYSDKVIEQFAASYLVTAVGMLGVYRELKPDQPSDEQRKSRDDLKSFLDRSLIDDPPAIAKTALYQAAGRLREELNGGESRDPTQNEIMLMAAAPSMLKNHRQFVLEFSMQASGESDAKTGEKVRNRYTIDVNPEGTWAVQEGTNSRMGLKKNDGRWWIDNCWRETDEKADPAK